MPERKIGNRTFVITPVAPMTSFALQPLIAPAAGRLVGLILKALGGDEGLSIDSLTVADLMEKAPELAAQIGDAFGSVRPDDLTRVVRGLLGGLCSCDGVPLYPVAGDDKVFNGLFAGRTRDIWEVLWFAVQVNYPDFLPARVGSAVPSRAENPSEALSNTAPSGPS